jgi:hypothetical protein
MTVRLKVEQPRPYFAEVPYYLWGQVNYDSEGNCRRPTDRDWTDYYLQNRTTGETVVFKAADATPGVLEITGEALLTGRAARLLIERCGATPVDGIGVAADLSWDHDAALRRTQRIRDEFPRPELKPFDTHLFWGSCKWVGWFATDFTWVGRWIMNSVLTGDSRAVCLCIHWLKDGTFNADQSTALRYALQRLTGLTFATDKQWVDWYDGGLLRRAEGKRRYPEPDFDQWLADLKRQDY